MRVQMLGLIRFSYLGGRGFQSAPEPLEERRAYLYDPERLARRWQLFETLTVPALRAQTDPDFTAVVMTGPDLPEPWLGRLRALAAEIPQLRLSLLRPMEYHRAACWHAVAPHRDPEAEAVGHFRLDDDDAVAVDFIDRTRREARRLRPILKNHGAVAIDWMAGLVLRPPALELRMIHQATAALTILLPPEVEKTAVHFPHHTLPQDMPVLAQGGPVMFLRSQHGDNDSPDVGHGWALPAPPGGCAALLGPRFAIDPAAVLALPPVG